MMELRSNYDAGDKKLRVEYQNNLIKKYRSKLLESIKSAGFPKGTTVEEPESNRIVLVIPMEIDETSIQNGKGRLDLPMAEKLSNLFNNFVTDSLNKEVMTTEIIPLQGYPLEDLKKDVIAAIQGKRNFCVIDTYESYKKFNSRESISMKQVKFKYLSKEYCNLAIEIETSDNLDKIVEKYSPILKETDWI